MARRLLLSAQGLLDDPARRATPKALVKLIHQMGFVQIDSINVVQRAHHLTLFSRLRGYRPAMLATLLEQKRTLFEHWTHDASAIPVEWFGHWKHRFERYRRRDPEHGWWKVRLGPRPSLIITQVIRRIEAEGPLMSKDFERPGTEGPNVEDAWWQWRPHKAALEHLWRCGELAVARRVNFQKVYDLTERVLPDHHALPAPDEVEHLDWACGSALQRLGVATPGEIAAFWNAVDLAQARQWCERAAQRGEIVQVLVQCDDDSPPRPAYAPPDWNRRVADSLDESPPSGIRLLSPFDPVLRDRRRTRRLFNFDYSFEGFVPAAKRRYGYYVMPMLEADRLIGRINPKFDRDRGELQINGLWWEPDVKATAKRRGALEEALAQLAAFIGAHRIHVCTS
jgi:hypothetical protein